MNMEKQILVSLPTLAENNFKKSIVYVDQHDGDGAHGWILNKELDQRVGLKLRKSMNLTINAPVYYGGPVDINQVFIIHSNDLKIQPSSELNDNFCVTRDKQLIDMFNNNNFPQYWRIVVGHCSWGAGQLESELLGSRTMGKSLWTNCPFTQALMWNIAPNNQWERGIEMSAKARVKDYLNF